MKCLQREGSNSPSPIITLMIGSLGGLIFGYDTGIMALAGIHVQREFNVPDTDNVTKGFITSIVLFGAMLGSFACGIMATKLGRRLTAFISAGICLFGGVTAAFSVDLASFMILRFILGIGIGIVGVVCPMYVSETAPREYTGTYGVIFQLMLTLGILLSYIVGFGLNRISDPHLAWRIMLGSGGGLFAIALMFVVFFGAVETYKGSMIASQHLVAGYEKKKRGGAFDLISLEKLPQTISGVVLAVTLQLTGINAIMYYGPIIIKESGFDNEDALNIGIGVWNFLTTFIAAFLVDRVGRRLLMVGGTAVMSLALIAVAICLSPFVPDGTGKGYGVAIGLAFFIGGFEGGAGCLFWVLANEIFDEDVREAGASMSNVLQWGFNLVVSSLFPLMFGSIGPHSTFYIFGGFGVLCTIYLFFQLKERPPEAKVLV